MSKQKMGIVIAVFGITTLVMVCLFSAFTLTFRLPVQGCSSTYPGRITLYYHSSENYTGKAILVPNDLTNPHYCSGDNGTHVLVGTYGSLKVYDANGTVLSELSFQPNNWIDKESSGIVVWDSEFGGWS